MTNTEREKFKETYFRFIVDLRGEFSNVFGYFNVCQLSNCFLKIFPFVRKDFNFFHSELDNQSDEYLISLNHKELATEETTIFIRKSAISH